MIRITVYAGPAPTDDPDDAGSYTASVGLRGVFDTRDVSEELRQIGLEWRQADYFQNRQALIVLDPVEHTDRIQIEDKVRKAAAALEETGLL